MFIQLQTRTGPLRAKVDYIPALNGNVLLYITGERQVVDCHGSGSPMYLAPETILERPVNCAVDIWACGVILYLLLVSTKTLYAEILVDHVHIRMVPSFSLNNRRYFHL